LYPPPQQATGMTARTAAADYVHGIRNQEQSLNRLSALRVKLEKEAKHAENARTKAELMSQCHDDHKQSLARIDAAVQKKAVDRKVKMDAHAKHLEENPGGAQAKVNAIKQQNAVRGSQLKEASLQADEMLEQRKAYFLEQNKQMASYVKETAKQGIEYSMKSAADQRRALAEERKQQSKVNSERAQEVQMEQKKIKAEKKAKVQQSKQNCREFANRLTEEKRSSGSEMRERIYQEEEMLAQRNDYFLELNKARHDDVKGAQGAHKQLMMDQAAERQANGRRDRQMQADKQAKLDQQKAEFMQKRRETTSERRTTVADRARKSVNDLRTMKRDKVSKDRAEAEQFTSQAIEQQEAFSRAIQEEEQRLLEQLQAVKRGD